MSTRSRSPQGGGRPAPPKKQSKHVVKVYLTADEKQQVKQNAARTGLSLSSYGRRRLLRKDHPLFEAVLKTDLRMIACTLREIESQLTWCTAESSEDNSPKAVGRPLSSGEIASQMQAALQSVETQMKALEETFGR